MGVQREREREILGVRGLERDYGLGVLRGIYIMGQGLKSIFRQTERERFQIRGLERDRLWVMDLERKREADYGLGFQREKLWFRGKVI